MPLTESVCFKAALQTGNRVQIPRLFRWQYRMKAYQVLKVYVRIADSFGDEWFLARMTKDGRLTIPKLASKLSARYLRIMYYWLPDLFILLDATNSGMRSFQSSYS